MGSKLCDKMHLKGDISKKQQIFGLCPFFCVKQQFFGNNSFQVHFVTKLRHHFWNLCKITDFFIPIKSYFERKKIQTLLSGFVKKNIHKNQSRAEITQNNEKRLFYFRFSTRIHFQVSKMQILKKVKNHSTLLYRGTYHRYHCII